MVDTPPSVVDAAATARRLVEARRQAVALTAYPGAMPADLASGYAIQDAAIALWPDEVAGWKIGLVPPQLRPALGVDRLAGPIFKRNVVRAKAGESVDLPVMRGGFAAVEAEFILQIARDQDGRDRPWRTEDAAQMIGAVFIGIELAGSPFAGINDHGPAVTASDFGNNAGLVVGSEVKDWRGLDWRAASAQTSIDAEPVGEGNAAMLPGGPLAALAFLLNHCAVRGRPLQKGQLVSSGAVTGVHRIEAGQSAVLSFNGFGELRCRAVQARGEDRPTIGAAL